MKNDIELANLILDLEKALTKFQTIEGSFVDPKSNIKINSAITGVLSLLANFRISKNLNPAQRNFAHKLITNAKQFS